MTQLLDQKRARRPFALADILSRMGETICIVELEIPVPKAATSAATQTTQRVEEADAERWDGLS